MNDLLERPLSDALRIAAESVPVSPENEYGITGIYSFGRGLIQRPTIRGSDTSYNSLTRLRPGQLTMSKLNAWEGALAVVPEKFDGTFVSPEYPVFDIDNRVADPAYIAHLVKWPSLWERLTPRGSMVRRKRTASATLLATKVPLPDLPEQRRIAVQLDAAFGKLKKIEAAQANATGLRSALMDSLLMGVGESVPLGALLQPTLDTIPVLPDDTYATAGILSYGRGLFARPVVDGSETSYTSYNRIHTGQFVYSKLFGWEGALAVVPEDFDGFHMSHEFPAFDIDVDQADPSYVYHLARWAGLHESLRNKGTGVGSRRQRVTPSRLLATKVPLPELPEQRRIADFLDKITASERLAEKRIACAKTLASSLLNAAFGGEL